MEKRMPFIFVLYTMITSPFANECMAQFGGDNIEEYKASNGITYKIGDKIKLGIGSAPDGSFNFITMRNALLMDASYSSKNNLNRMFAGKMAEINKIKSVKDGEQVYFVVGGLTAVKWALMIEEAIVKCEIADCKKSEEKPVVDKYDQLRKLKELLDSKAITETEYNTEKQKILNQ